MAKLGIGYAPLGMVATVERAPMSSSSRKLAVLLLPALLTAWTLLPTTPAAAATVPGEVTNYIANDLVNDLNEFYGPGTDGAGRLFTDTTTVTPGTRIFGFTPEVLAGRESNPPVRRLNEWLSVVSIDDAPIGFAIVSIDPVTVSPQLASFTESAEFGAVVTAMNQAASLVRDDDRAAWFSLEGEQLTPIVAGSSGIAEPVTVDEYRAVIAAQLAVAADSAPEQASSSGGLIIAGIILVLVVLLLALEAFLPYWRKRAPVEPEAEHQRVPRKKPTVSG
jgi:hypothetical protein